MTALRLLFKYSEPRRRQPEEFSYGRKLVVFKMLQAQTVLVSQPRVGIHAEAFAGFDPAVRGSIGIRWILSSSQGLILRMTI